MAVGVARSRPGPSGSRDAAFLRPPEELSSLWTLRSAAISSGRGSFSGQLRGRYDALRPRPPSDLIELLSDLAPGHPPQLVVDLGCSTRISTVAWAGLAERALGIDQNPEMLASARPAPNVEYRRAAADATVARGRRRLRLRLAAARALGGRGGLPRGDRSERYRPGTT